MIADLKPYAAMKDSGVPWLGQVPEHWDLVPNRALMTVKKQIVGERADDYTLLSLTKRGIIARDMVNPEGKFPTSFETYQAVEPGDLVFCLFDIDETPRAVGLSSLSGMITGAYTVFACRDAQARRFIYWLYLSFDNAKLLKPLYSGLRKVITKSTFLSAKLALPPAPEQRAIVRYLDYIDRRVRRYILAKQKLIGLLEEQKQAIIHRAVTRGLDPNVPLKPSGVEWLGDVPEHWEVRRLKFLAHIKTGGRDTVDRKDDGDYPFFVRSQTVERIDSYSFDGEAVLTAGDGAGVAKVFHHYVGKFDYHQRVYKFSNFRNIRGKFFFYYLSCTLRYVAFRETAKSTVDSLRLPMLQNFPVALPPSDEQVQIVEAIETETATLERSLTTVKRKIELLREYRTRLIADVVTGNLDVRQAAANLPDELPEPGPLDQVDDLMGESDALSDDLKPIPEEAGA